MVVVGFIMFVLFVCVFYYSIKYKIIKLCWLLKSVFYGLLFFWIVCEVGWFVVEYGCQLWLIVEVFLVYMLVFNFVVSDVVIIFVVYSVFYIGMFIIGFYLMKKFVKKGLIFFVDKQFDIEFDFIDFDE